MAEHVTIESKPHPVTVEIEKAAVIVVEMQNDFGAEGGLFQRAGIDISMIQAAVAPTASSRRSPPGRHQHNLPEDGVQA
jgi:ureidoacrylate peracid hydrolase